jgi:hypothetical protein
MIARQPPCWKLRIDSCLKTRSNSAESAIYRPSFTVRTCYDVRAARAGSCKDTLATGNLCRELRYRGLGTQRSDDSLTTNPQHLERRVSLIPLSDPNMGEVMQLMQIILTISQVYAVLAY